MLSYKNRQVGSANAIKNGIIINAQQMVKFIAEVICFFSFNDSFLLFNSVRLGTIAVANDPIRVEGIEINGSVMPIAMPNWLSAWSLVKPAATSPIGSKKVINGCVRLVNSLTSVIGVADCNIGLKQCFGFASLPFDV
jgi:hypothetical protein